MENELYPGQAEELRQRAERIAAIERAHSAVLPGALREAFAGDPRPAGDYTLQPVTLGLAANLDRIKSSLLDVVRIMREVYSEGPGESSLESSAKSAPSADKSDLRLLEINRRLAGLKFEEEQIAETVFVFTRPQKRIRKLLDAGRDKFRETVMDELGDKLHPTQMAALQQACAQHYVASFATIIGYGAPPDEGEVVFPPPSLNLVTDSAGG